MLLLDMPPEILIQIAEELDLKSLSQLSQASKRFRELLKEHPNILMKVLAKASENDLYDYLINNNITVPIYEDNQFVPKKPLLTLAKQYHQFFKNKIYDTTRFELPMRPSLQAHTGWVNALVLLPNNRLVTGSSDNTIKIWDMETWTCLQTLTGHGDYVKALILLPHNHLASASDDCTIKIWDMETWTCLQTLTGHRDRVRALILLPNNRLASASYDSTIKIWDMETGACLRTLTGHTDWVRSLTLLPNNRLASGSDDKTIKIWDINTGNCLHTCNLPAIVTSLRYEKGRLYAGLDNSAIQTLDFARVELDNELRRGESEVVLNLIRPINRANRPEYRS